MAIFPVNGKFILAVYKGNLSEFDLLLKYRQLEDGKWSRIRTPKHIHWAVDILIKQHCENDTTDRFLKFLINLWDAIILIKTEEERDELLNTEKLIGWVDNEAIKYSELANKGEYSIRFLILIAKLLMTQEKTNYKEAYMFKKLLIQLKEHHNIFQVVSTATYS